LECLSESNKNLLVLQTFLQKNSTREGAIFLRYIINIGDFTTCSGFYAVKQSVI
jgi:hypothetical protein